MPLPLIETTEIEVLRTQFLAWMDGVNGRFAGLKVPDCPYAPRTAAGDAWENGWDVTNRHLKDMNVTEDCDGAYDFPPDCDDAPSVYCNRCGRLLDLSESKCGCR